MQDQLALVSQLFRARLILFDYPGYGLNRNPPETPLVAMVSAIAAFAKKHGYREERIVLFGYEHGCGPALAVAHAAAAQKRAALRTDSSGLVMFFPVDSTPLGFPLEFPELYNETQNITYFRILIFVAKKDKLFRSFDQLKKLKRDAAWRSRVTVVDQNFQRQTITTLGRRFTNAVAEMATAWLGVLNDAVMKERLASQSVAAAANAVMRVSKKVPPLPVHPRWRVERLLTRCGLDGLLPAVEERHIHSTVFLVMSAADSLGLVGEDPDLVAQLSKVTGVLKPLVRNDWQTNKRDILGSTLRRVESATEFVTHHLRKVSRTSETPDDAEDDRPAVPAWAKGIGAEGTFTRQKVNFSDFFAFQQLVQTQN